MVASVNDRKTEKMILADIYLLKINNINTSNMFKVIKKKQKDVNEVALAILLLTLNIFYAFFQYFYCYFGQVNVNWAKVIVWSLRGEKTQLTHKYDRMQM